MDVGQAVSEIDDQLRVRGTSERAENEKRYLKSRLVHYGTTVPDIRAVAKTAAGHHRDIGHDEWMELLEALWERPVHERRMLSLEWLVFWRDRLDPSDLDRIEVWLRQARTWAIVDPLSAAVVGPLVERYPELNAVLDRWADDDDFWIRRASLLALLPGLKRGDGDFDRFSRYADTMLEDKEFFIRKAIGWVLCETAKTSPSVVFEWLLPRVDRVSGVTLREALKPLSARQRERLQRMTGKLATG
jgi:3-methyladenine DNA glycosylase AlkD